MVEEGQVHFAEVGGISGPVVHLHVDVGVHVAVPEAGVAAVVPDTLEVAGRVDGGVEVGTDGEVAAILEVEGFEEEAVHARLVLRLCVVELDEVFGGHGAFAAEVEVNATHEFLVLSHVVGEERLVALSNGCADAALYLFGQLSGGFARFTSSLVGRQRLIYGNGSCLQGQGIKGALPLFGMNKDQGEPRVIVQVRAQARSPPSAHWPDNRHTLHQE